MLLASVCVAGLLAACGGGGGGGSGSTTPIEYQTIAGKVIDGAISGALVCLDSNGNGRCDGSEPQARSAAGGAYQLAIPKGSTAPLVAEIVAGQAQDGAGAGSAIDRSFRMTSPLAYSTDITPYTTLVQLMGEADYALAEDLVRNVVALPPRFALDAAFAASPGSVAQMTATHIATALKSLGTDLDLSSANALAQVTAALPAPLTTLPEFRITTKNGAPIDSKEIYVDATFTLLNPVVSTQAVPLNGKIRGRGHSTWELPKKPYKVQLANDAAYAAMADMLGMKKQRNWALLADYNDRTLIRNKLALSLGNSSVFNDGMKWNPSGQHVEVYLNGGYQGLYLMTEDIRIDANRLNIKKMGSADVDGGYIVEVDWRLDCYNDGTLNLQHRTPLGVPVCIDTPDEGSITQSQLAYIKGLVDATEASLYGPRKLDAIHPASFADWYLIQELFRNNDAAYFSSVFLWKDTDSAAIASDRLLNMGPLWDFDISAGNVNYNDNWLVEGCWVAHNLPQATNWMAGLFDNPAFVDLTIARWKQKRRVLGAFVNASIDAYAARLAAAQQRNFVRWAILGIPLSGHFTYPTYAGEVGFLKSYLNERMMWLDRAYASNESFRSLCK
jgi:hypothetical protein